MRAARFALPLLALVAACSDPAARSNAQPPLAEPTRRAPESAAQMKASFAPVVRKAAPAVVNVFSRRVVRQQVDPFWSMFSGGMGAPQSRVEQSLGSGVLVRADGVIVTNNHVIQGGTEIQVVLADRREFAAKVLLADPRTDIAVLKIEPPAGQPLPVLAIDDQPDQLQVGDLVLAIGDPFGVGQTVTNGIVSALARTEVGATDYSYFIQTDAAINPGNSGGALVDMDGDLVGLNTFILSRSGTSSGVGFAIPAPLVKQVVEAAVGGGRSVVRPWLGVRGQAVTGEVARALGLAAPNGVLINQVYGGGVAERAGLRQGDVILTVDGQAVNDEASLTYRIGTHRVGDEVQLGVRRAGRTDALRVRLAAPPSGERDQRTLTGLTPFGGATVLNFSPAAAEELGVDAFSGPGVLVSGLEAGSAAQRVGLRRGDLIRQVNGQRIDSVRTLAAAAQAGAQQGGWRVTIVRDGRETTADFRP